MPIHLHQTRQYAYQTHSLGNGAEEGGGRQTKGGKGEPMSDFRSLGRASHSRTRSTAVLERGHLDSCRCPAYQRSGLFSFLWFRLFLTELRRFPSAPPYRRPDTWAFSSPSHFNHHHESYGYLSTTNTPRVVNIYFHARGEPIHPRVCCGERGEGGVGFLRRALTRRTCCPRAAFISCGGRLWY